MDYDVIVIGGGSAGLSGATVLARSRRRVLVLDSGEPRNAPADGVHAFLSRDGMAPRELLTVGTAEFEAYGGEVRRVTASSARPVEGGFAVYGSDGRTVTARRLLVTTGSVDELPDVPGLRERWGHEVVHCPYCHGWEVRDRRIVVFATGPTAEHQVLLFRQLSAEVTLLLHEQPEPDAEGRRRLAALGVPVVAKRATTVEGDADALTGIRLEDGELLACDTIAIASRVVARSGVIDGLGLSAQPFLVGEAEVGTHLATDPAGRTDVPGVWAAGNVVNPMAQVVVAAAAGTTAGAQLNLELAEADLAARLTDSGVRP